MVAILALGFTVSISIAQVPAYEASLAQTAQGTAGAPYYVSPRDLSGLFSNTASANWPVWYVSIAGTNTGKIGNPAFPFDHVTAETQVAATNHGSVVYFPGNYSDFVSAGDNGGGGALGTNYIQYVAAYPHTVNWYVQGNFGTCGLDALHVNHNEHYEGLNIFVGSSNNPVSWINIIDGNSISLKDIVFDNCRVEGWSDNFAFQIDKAVPYEITIKNCELISRWDIFAGTGWNGLSALDTNSFFKILNCSLLFKHQNARTNYCFGSTNISDAAHVFNQTDSGAQRLIMKNCRIEMTGFGGSEWAAITANKPFTNNQYLELKDIAFVMNGQCTNPVNTAGGIFSPIDYVNTFIKSNQTVAVSDLTYVSNGVVYNFNVGGINQFTGTISGDGGGLTNITYSPTVLKTNLTLATSGAYAGHAIQILPFSINLSEAGVVGVSGMQIEVAGQMTNRVTSITSIAGTIVGSDTNTLGGIFVPSGSTWFIRDISQGAGNAATIGNQGQQIIVY